MPAQDIVSNGFADQVLTVWATFSLMFQDWVLSSRKFIALASKLSLIPSVAVLGFGLFTLSFGSRNIPFRIISIAPGLLIGWFLGGWIASATGLSPIIFAYGLAIALAILGGYSGVSLFAIPFGFLISIFAFELSEPWFARQDIDAFARMAITLGSAVGAAILAIATERVTTAISCSVVASLTTVLGFLGLARNLRIKNAITESGYFVPGALVLIFILSAIVHFHYLFTEDERRKANLAKAQEKAEVKEDKERMKRFENYGKPSKSRRK